MKIENPIPELVSNRDYEILIKNNLLDKTAIKYYMIKRDYKHYKQSGVPAEVLYSKLMDKYKLKRESIRKLIYKNYEKKSF